MSRELSSLREAVFRLEAEVSSLREALSSGPVERTLAQRGHVVLSHGGRGGLLLPPDAPAPARDVFYGLMGRYSFRLFARDLIRFPRGPGVSALTRYCPARIARAYLRALADLGVVTLAEDGGYALSDGRTASFGPSLEWYAAEVLRREFLAPALFGVTLAGTSHGGDYDVLALLHGALVYVEVKSSPPRGVEAGAVSAYLGRVAGLRPAFSVFLVDTALRMKDKIVPLFEAALAALGAPPGALPVERLAGEVFHIARAVYLANSRRGVPATLRACARDFFKHEGEARLAWPLFEPPREGKAP